MSKLKNQLRGTHTQIIQVSEIEDKENKGVGIEEIMQEKSLEQKDLFPYKVPSVNYYCCLVSQSCPSL